jgi:hypothetical protein
MEILAVRHADGQKQIMARFPVFFIGIGVLCAALVGVASAPLFQPTGVSIEARASPTGWIVDGIQLLNLVPTKGFPVALPPGSFLELEGVRMTAAVALTPETKHLKTVRLNLGPGLAQTVSKAPRQVTIQVRATPRLPASAMAVGWVVNGQVIWVVQPVSNTFNAVKFPLPQPTTPPTALAIWPSVQGEHGGIEVKSILVSNSLPNG